MVRLYLLRHCETDWNKEKKYLGRTDLALNENGIKSAKILSEFLKQIKFDKIYSSEYLRAYQTAKIIGKNKEIEKFKYFNEIDFGDWEGLTFNQITEIYGKEIVDKYLKDPLNFKFSNGESFKNLYKRVTRGLNFILDTYNNDNNNNNNKNILIVGHSGVNRIIIGKALKISFKKSFWRIKQDLGCINIINFVDDFPIIELLNGKFI